MDVKTAINVLKKSYPKTTKMINGHLEGEFDNLEFEFGQALTLAINALDRNVPKKPDFEEEYFDICAECANCGSFIGYEVDCKDENYQINFCPNCGQAIDWSKINDWGEVKE